MQDVYQTVRLMSAPELVGGTKDFFGWKSRFGTVSGAKSMVSALSMEWMQEACNGTSSDTVELGNENMANVEKEESKSNEDAEEWSAETSFWTSNPRANKYSSAVEDEVEIKDCWEHEKNAHCRPRWWKSRKKQDETEVSSVELCLASLTHGQDFCSAR